MTNQSMYTAGQIAAGVALGGPIAGIAMLRSNLIARNDPDAARRTLIYGILLTIAFLLAVPLTSHILPPMSLNTGVVVAFLAASKSLNMHKKALKADNVQINSNYRVVGLSALSYAATIIIGYVLLFLLIFAFALKANYYKQ